MNTVQYDWDEYADASIDLAFNKKRADDRKTWLASFDRKRHLDIGNGTGIRVGYTQFVNDELIHFSNEDNIRSLPHVMDGLKPSQRKIFWSALKRNLTSEIRVAQLAGYVSEHAAYHHGEASLNGAIIGMAQNFVGSNNLNLLSPNGQFGTRLMGGKDAAAPRYIHTELMPIVRSLVKKEDNAILEYTQDDGLFVEPVNFLPVIPLLLVNGALGIGTGFSSDVLPYNPKDIVGAVKMRLMNSMFDLRTVELTPWWYGFKGRVYPGSDGKTWITKGVYEFMGDDSACVRVTELPVGTWTQDYKDYLESMLIDQENELAAWKSGKKPGSEKPVCALKNYTANYNDVEVDFILELDSEYYHEARAYVSEFESKFKMTSSFKTSNMVAFNTSGKIQKYGNVGNILDEFYTARLDGYRRRKAHEMERMSDEIGRAHV